MIITNENISNAREKIRQSKDRFGIETGSITAICPINNKEYRRYNIKEFPEGCFLLFGEKQESKGTTCTLFFCWKSKEKVYYKCPHRDNVKALPKFTRKVYSMIDDYNTKIRERTKTKPKVYV